MPTQLFLNFAEYYDRHADEYLAKKRAGLLFFNDAIEVPATLKVLSDRAGRISGKLILDIGSGLGTYSKHLGMQGARVTAIDISSRMTDLTKEACKGLDVECLNVDFFDFLPKENYQYQFVVAGFMLGYFSSLEKAFEKFRKVTARGGTVILSSIHPFKTSYHFKARHSDNYLYFGRNYHESDFISGEEPLQLRRWLIEEVTEAAYEAKFAVDKIVEPRPSIHEKDSSELYEHYSNYPSVVIYILRKR